MKDTADPEDLFSDSLQTLYDYTPITHSSAGALFTYTRPPLISKSDGTCRLAPRDVTQINITLKTPETQAGNWSLHASSIWVASLFIADHLEDLHLDSYIDHARQQGNLPLRILELGAGAGLPGILIAKIYGKDIRVISSDYPDDTLIDTLKENVERNDVSEWCRVVPYAWGSDVSALRSSTVLNGHENDCDKAGFDIIVAADTLWNPELHSPFLNTLHAALKKSTESMIYLVAGLHTGRYTLGAFLNMVPDFGLKVEEVKEREVVDIGKIGSVRQWSVDRAEVEDERERRRWVVWISISFA